MRIACLGWGSLIWNPGDLPISSNWFSDGPELPIEFARQSNNGRITLVVTDDSQPIPVLWAEMATDSPDHARLLLANREGVSEKNATRLIGLWTRTDSSTASALQEICDWASTARIDAVVWTALGPKFSGANRKPTQDEVIDYLGGLTGDTRTLAEEYIRKTPEQIHTDYRPAIEDALGWYPAE